MRDKRNNGFSLRAPLSEAYYLLREKLAETKIPCNAGDFRVLNRKAVDALRQLPERNRFMKGLFSRIGSSQAELPYVEEKRASGDSSWSINHLFRYGLSTLISFSSMPLRLWVGVSAFIATMSVFYAAYVVIETFVFGRDVPGYATIVTAIFFLGGVKLFSIGVLGEYLASMFDEAKRRPVCIISETQDAKHS